MQYFYSIRSKLMYCDEVNPADTIPADAIKITEGQFKQILEARSKGFIPDYNTGVFTFSRPPKVYPDVPPEADIELALREVRNERLRESDWTQVPDCPLAGNKEVLEYRKKLRDVPQEKGFPMVDLPVAPAIINTL